MKTKRQDIGKDRKEEQQKQHSWKLDERCFFSDLTEEQLMPSFAKVRKFRFDLCKVFLSYNSVDAKARRIHKQLYSPGNDYTYDLPNDTSHGTIVGSGHQLFGTIQAAGFSLDPASPPYSIFNRRFNDPIDVPKLGCLTPQYIRYCSIPFSTSVKIDAELYVATDKVVDMGSLNDYYTYLKRAPEQFNDAFEICNDSAVLNLSDYFSMRPNGGSCSYTLNGRDGYLKLCYVALKYAVDADLEVTFHATPEETKVAGRVVAYYGKSFDYGCSPAEVDDYKAMLFETEQPEVKPGKINLIRSAVSVPAQFSLIIDANLTDSTSGAIILSGVYEFFVPTDGSISVGRIEGSNCSLIVNVHWKLPPLAEETISSKRSYYSDLTKKQGFSERGVFAPLTLDEEDGRWSLQKEISSACRTLVWCSLPCKRSEVPVTISTGTEVDDCDYLCTSVLSMWPELRNNFYLDGPKWAGLEVKTAIGLLPQPFLLERCVVGGPGILKLKISRTWIAESIYMMLEHSILTWAPELPIGKAIIDFLPRNIAKEMHMGHLQSAIIGETLARVFDFSGVTVHRRFCCGDYLDTEVLYEESKAMFAGDAIFRDRTQPVQDLDERHKSALEEICKISRERYREVYQRLGVSVEEEGKTVHDFIGETRKLLREKGYYTESEGGDVIVIEGQKLPLVDFAALRYALEMQKVDRIVHVDDVGQRDKIEMCITAATSIGWTVTNHCHDPLSHVGFVQVEGIKGFDPIQLLDEAKSRCKAFLVENGKELEHSAEALGYGAVKYEVLKNNRLTDYTFSFDDMLRETGNTAVYLQKTHARICLTMEKYDKSVMESVEKVSTRKDYLTLEDDRERLLGLHLLRITEVLGEVCRVLAPHILCDYLFVLCDMFNGLYSWPQVLLSDEDSKILLFEATRVVVDTCFELLGITPIYNFKNI